MTSEFLIGAIRASTDLHPLVKTELEDILYKAGSSDMPEDKQEHCEPMLCPFCGGNAETHNVFIPWARDFGWVVGCDGEWGSGCPGYVWKLSPVFLTEEQAVRTWNRRTHGRVQRVREL